MRPVDVETIHHVAHHIDNVALHNTIEICLSELMQRHNKAIVEVARENMKFTDDCRARTEAILSHNGYNLHI